MNNDNLFVTLWASTIIALCIGIVYTAKNDKSLPKEPTKQEWKAYHIKINNEHEVQCVSGKDTVYLYFENAYNLADERVVYIER